jgi:hypothetical protein
MAPGRPARVISACSRDGLVHAPTEPDLGAHIDFDLIERGAELKLC